MKRFVFAILVMSVSLMAAKTGSIAGKITDIESGKAIAGVKVSIKGSGQIATSDTKGKFKISRLPEGTYTLKASRRNYESKSFSKIKVKKGVTTNLNIKLKSQAPKPKDWKSIAYYIPKDLVKSDRDKTGSDKVNQKPTASSVEATRTPEGKTAKGNLEVSKPRVSPAIPVESGEDEPLTGEMGGSEEFKFEPAPRPRITKPEASIIIPGDSPPSKKPSVYKPGPRPSPRPAGGLKAGYADDNQQFNYFLNFLEKYYRRNQAYLYDVSERIHIQLLDIDGKSLPNIEIKVYDKTMDYLLDQGTTYSDGSFYFFPNEIAERDQVFRLSYNVDGIYEIVDVMRNGPRHIESRTQQVRQAVEQVPVDIVFILDTTGSMQEEIKRLLATIDIIHLNLTNLPNQPLVRFGMVLYRDIEDKYRTKVIPLTADINEFRSALEQVEAEGGGDTPEDLQAALEKAVLGLEWNNPGLRLGFIITDAPPHLDYDQDFTYIKAALDARKQGIKMFGVGTGGLNIQGEYILRQIAQLTQAKYLFLTYGKETGENKGGRQGSVSHHTGSNYQTDKLEAIIIRIAKEEISNFTDDPFEQGEDYYEAQPVDHETREETLSNLFQQAISRLVDYSTLKLVDAPKLGVLPIQAKSTESGLNVEYFSEQVQLSVAQNKQFTLIARKDLQHVLDEQKLQLSGLITEDQTTRIGELLGAELLLSGELYAKASSFDIFLKLIRVETAEILAVTKIVLDKELGL